MVGGAVSASVTKELVTYSWFKNTMENALEANINVVETIIKS